MAVDTTKLEQTPEGVVLPVQAQPRARKNALIGWHNGRLKIAVTQAPEKGKANESITKLLAKTLRLKRGQVQLLSGETSTQKLFCLRDVSPEQLQRLIAAALEESA